MEKLFIQQKYMNIKYINIKNITYYLMALEFQFLITKKIVL